MWRSAIALSVLALAVSAGASYSQSPPTAPPAAAPATPAKAAVPKQCMRLPLSDIAVGRPETIALAQLRLREYADKEAKRRGWKGTVVKSAETVSCEDYLYLPLVGQEYKCLVTATFCAGPAAPMSKPLKSPVKSVVKASVKTATKAPN
jgi:hypothetical protein